MSLYELIILGVPTPEQLRQLTLRITETVAEFEMTIGNEVVIRTAADAASRDLKSATAAIYFGGDPAVDVALVDELEKQK